MKVGVACEFPGRFSGGDFLRRSAQAAERVGFASYWFGDHVLLFGSYQSKYPYAGIAASWDQFLKVGDSESKYPYPRISASGAKDENEPPMPDPRQSLVDPVMGMCWVVAATTKIEVGSTVVILPQRNPVVLAKEIICIDEFSGGRVTLGVGVGWCREEAEAIGVDWAARGKLTDEYIDVMRTLWRDDAAEFNGRTISFKDAYLYPRPARGHLPIMVGGDSDVALKRVARAGDGWLCFSTPADEIGARIALLKKLTRDQDRDPESLRISKAVFSWTTLDELERLCDAGVTEFILFLCGELSFDDAELNEQLAEAARRFVDPLAGW